MNISRFLVVLSLVLSVSCHHKKASITFDRSAEEAATKLWFSLVQDFWSPYFNSRKYLNQIVQTEGRSCYGKRDPNRIVIEAKRANFARVPYVGKDRSVGITCIVDTKEAIVDNIILENECVRLMAVGKITLIDRQNRTIYLQGMNLIGVNP